MCSGVMLCLALAFLVGVTGQVMPPSIAIARTSISADMPGGCASPQSPCTGHMPNSLDHGGCIMVSALPASPAQALSAFFIVSYTICILGYVLFPGMPVKHELLAIFLPGFTLLSWHTFFLGLIESFFWSWYIVLAFGRIDNFFLRRAARARTDGRFGLTYHRVQAGH
jgi:hypothetical protein